MLSTELTRWPSPWSNAATMTHQSLPPLHRRVFSNRTLNLRAIKAVGFDMDYTLVHYDTAAWERRAYDHLKQKLCDRGWPVGDFEFSPEAMSLGLILDLDQGNIVKANRFGYIKRATHGMTELPFERQRALYSRELVDRGERWVFLSSLFAMSEACMFGQLVDEHDARPLAGINSYAQLYAQIRQSVDLAHMEGELKAGVIAHPDRYVIVDPELPLTLLDLRHAGKKLLLITNSEWGYTHPLMAYILDRYLPEGQSWRDLFDYIIVQSRKPTFFAQKNPTFEVVNEEGLLRPLIGPLNEGGIYLGGHAGLVEETLGLAGEEILYVGDHIFGDVQASKSFQRWRTALVVPELDAELTALADFAEQQAALTELMTKKERLEYRVNQCRALLQRAEQGYAEVTDPVKALKKTMARLRSKITSLDEQIAPLARAGAELANPNWGLLMRTGHDKSYLARQLENSADIYMSRVSNLLHCTPFGYLRSTRGTLPHDVGL